jgi:hypothetical protein
MKRFCHQSKDQITAFLAFGMALKILVNPFRGSKFAKFDDPEYHGYLFNFAHYSFQYSLSLSLSLSHAHEEQPLHNLL